MTELNPSEIQAIRQEISEQLREVLNTKQAADYLGCSRQRLEIWRSQGSGPPYSKLSRMVRYRRSSLDEWLAAHEQSNTSQPNV